MAPRLIFEQELEQLKEKIKEMGEYAEIGLNKLLLAIKADDRDALNLLDRKSTRLNSSH